MTATLVHRRDSTVAIYRLFLEQTPEDTQGLLHVLKQNFSTAEETRILLFTLNHLVTEQTEVRTKCWGGGAHSSVQYDALDALLKERMPLAFRFKTKE